MSYYFVLDLQKNEMKEIDFARKGAVGEESLQYKTALFQLQIKRISFASTFSRQISLVLRSMSSHLIPDEAALQESH